MSLSQKYINEMGKTCTFLNYALGLAEFFKNTPIRRAIGVICIADTIEFAQLDL
jgi:hypothetical protein